MVQVYGNIMGKFGADQRHAVVRRGDAWSHLGADSIRPLVEEEAMEFDVMLPGSSDENPVLFISNSYWHPYSELRPYLDRISEDPGVRLGSLGTSVGGRPLYSVEIGSEDPDAPHMHGDSPDSTAIRDGHVDLPGGYRRPALRTGIAIRSSHRFTIVPATNPDGTVHA
jgi:hypothetical protein